VSTSGNASIRTAVLGGPVGDVLYAARIGIWSKDAAVWQRASDRSNRIADQASLAA